MKAPRTKNQAPKKLPAPSSKDGAGLARGCFGPASGERTTLVGRGVLTAPRWNRSSRLELACALPRRAEDSAPYHLRPALGGAADLVFGAGCFSGAWRLEFGASDAAGVTKPRATYWAKLWPRTKEFPVGLEIMTGRNTVFPPGGNIPTPAEIIWDVGEMISASAETIWDVAEMISASAKMLRDTLK
jgi:hypothetical protein